MIAGTPSGEADLLLVHGGDRESRLRRGRNRPGAGLLVSPPPQDAEAWDAVVREATIAARWWSGAGGPLDPAGGTR